MKRLTIAVCAVLLAHALYAQLPVPGGSTGGGGGGSESTSAANSGAGSQVLKAGTNVTARTLSAGTNVTITQNTDDITIAATSGGMGDPGGNGVMVRTASNTSTNRTVTGTANKITVTNGDGVSGNPTITIADALDLSASTSTKPSKTGTSAPGTCAVGETFIDTDASAAAQFLICTATNTWTAQGSGSGDVTAASAFGTDNRMVRSDGTGKGVQATGITVDDSNNMTGVASVSVGSGSAIGTVTVLEGTAPSAPGTAGEHTIYVDSADSRMKSKNNGGTVSNYAKHADFPTCADTGGQHLNYSSGSFSCGTSGDGTGGESVTSGTGPIWIWGWPGAGQSFSPVAGTRYYMRFTLQVGVTLRYVQTIGNRANGNYLACALYDATENKVTGTDWRANGQGSAAYDIGDLGASGVALSSGVYFLGCVAEAGSVYGYTYIFGGLANQISGAPQNFSGSSAATGSGATLTMPATIGSKTNVGLDTVSFAAMLVTK